MSRHLDNTGQGHPILGFLDALESGLDDIADAPAWSLNAEETTQVVTRLVADLARLAEVDTRLLGQANTLDRHGSMGARSVSQWLARTTRHRGSRPRPRPVQAVPHRSATDRAHHRPEDLPAPLL